MSGLDALIPHPRLHELDVVELAASPGQVWEIVRHGDLGQGRLTRALFAIRTLPDRLARRTIDPPILRLDDMRSTPEVPGFQILAEDPSREVVVGAIGKVWRLEIPFVHVADADAYAGFAEPGWIRVAWALRVIPWGERDARVELELRVDATDDASWRKFRRYFALIGPASRGIRRALLRSIAGRFGRPEQLDNVRPLPGDDLVPDAAAQMTHTVTIAASPAKIWPWLVQMGSRRAGFYSIDMLDNAGRRSAREIHPELQELRVGQVIPATPRGEDGFEVLRIDAPRVLVLGGLFDPEGDRQLPFASPRPPRYWHTTWAFVLEELDRDTTRLHVRVRGAASARERLRLAWIRPVHAIMQRAQLANLAARAEGRRRRDDWRDVVEGLGGALRIALDYVTPRRRRARWGLDAESAARVLPGDELIRAPTWGWTHAIEIAAPAEHVWPWVAQIGADRAGFYSYQWLENLAGCRLRNAETIHPQWALQLGDGLVLHPDVPPLRIVELAPGQHFVAHAAPDLGARRWVAASWLFLVEPLGPERCRFISRYRVTTSRDLRTRVAFGERLVEPIGFAMDRRMLIGVKQRAEQAT
jgi:hypothetical protein